MQNHHHSESDRRLVPGKKVLLGGVACVGAALVIRSLVRRRRKIELSGKNVVIMGGSRGLGLCLAREYAGHGANLILCARDADELARAKTDLESARATVATHICDVTDAAHVGQTVMAIEASGPIDVLVNCAGTILVGPVDTMSLEDFHRVMDVNFWGALHAIFAVMPGMKRRGFGRIVNIASIGGKIAVPHLAAYCASKFALVGLSGALRTEFKKAGILVTTVNPGLMRTGSPRNAFMKGNTQAEYAWFSISDSLPGVSISAVTAARRVVAASIYGKAEVTIGLPAFLGAKLAGLAPSIQLELAAMADRLLPRAGEDGMQQQAVPGYTGESRATQSFLRVLGKRAEVRNNQLPSV